MLDPGLHQSDDGRRRRRLICHGSSLRRSRDAFGGFTPPDLGLRELQSYGDSRPNTVITRAALSNNLEGGVCL